MFELFAAAMRHTLKTGRARAALKKENTCRRDRNAGAAMTMRRIATFATVALLLGGCGMFMGESYTYRNPTTGATAQCQKHYLVGGLSPWREGISHSFLQTCVDNLNERGFTERVF